MTADPNGPVVDGKDQAPKLLLDTNVYLDLADGLLPSEGERLEAIAGHRYPPLLWSCQITSDELVSRTCEGPETFRRYREALWWMDRLCSLFGMTEPLWWVVRRGVFASLGPKDDDLGELGRTLVDVRRAIIRADTYDLLPFKIRSTIENRLRSHYAERIDAWVEKRTKLNEEARKKVMPGDPGIEDTVLAANAVLAVSRDVMEKDIPTWGPQRDEADQRHEQREQIAFEVALLRKAQNRDGYNHAKRRSDYNDYWLCAYPAAGYTIVTREKRLPEALNQGGCVIPVW